MWLWNWEGKVGERGKRVLGDGGDEQLTSGHLATS